MVAKLANVFKKHEITHFKWLNFWFSELYLKKMFFLITSDGCTKMNENVLRVYLRWDLRTLETGIL